MEVRNCRLEATAEQGCRPGKVDMVTDRWGGVYQFFHYSAFGEVLAQRHAYTGSFSSRYLFNAKEFDNETGFGYYGARYYQPEWSVWLSVDRLAEKYPFSTPYSFGGNNPIAFIDPNGDSLDIALNGVTFQQLLSIVGVKYRDRVTHNDNGRINVNLDGLEQEELASIDKGLYVINLMANSENKYFFSVDDFEDFGEGENYMVMMDVNGVVNASNGGKDGNGGYTHTPKNGYDGQVAISRSGSFTDLDGWRDARKSVTFHELYENYLRTDQKMDYRGSGEGGNDRFGAHGRATQLENRGRSFGNSTPGSALYKKPENAREIYKNRFNN